ERGDQSVRARRFGGADRVVHITDQITCALRSEGIWNWRFEAEDGHRPDRGQHQLRHRAALGRSYREDSLLGLCAAKCRNQTCDEAIEIVWSHIDMRGVVLRPYGHAYSWLCTLGKTAAVW